jgi:iron complex transport system ATP-binding protein
MTPTAPLLECHHASFHYGGRYVLEDIGLRLEQGECAALIGANGAGKTTLLRLFAGTLTPSGGQVLLEGRSLAALPQRERARLVALVPQQLDVPFDFTVEEIVAQGRTPYLGLLRGPGRRDREAVERALELTDTAALRTRIFNELSGGERQRVKIALGLAQQARLLLLDEPTQNLDIGRQAEFLDLLHRLRQEGMTVLASIHDLHLIHGNFSTVHLLLPDRTLRSGDPAEVLTGEQLAHAFHCRPGHRLFPSLAHPQQEHP